MNVPVDRPLSVTSIPLAPLLLKLSVCNVPVKVLPLAALSTRPFAFEFVAEVLAIVRFAVELFIWPKKALRVLLLA